MRPRQAERPSLRKAHFASSAFLSSVSALSASDAERGDTPSDGRGNAEREINRLLPNLRDPQAVCDCSRTAHILTQTPGPVAFAWIHTNRERFRSTENASGPTENASGPRSDRPMRSQCFCPRLFPGSELLPCMLATQNLNTNCRAFIFKLLNVDKRIVSSGFLVFPVHVSSPVT